MSVETLLIWSVPVIGVIGVIFALFLARDILARDTGTKEMEAIGKAIFQGATAYLRRQYQTIALFALVAAVLVGALIGGFTDFDRGWRTSVSFLVGAFLSGLSGFIGMYVAVRSNI